jgi:hypothetical protein
MNKDIISIIGEYLNMNQCFSHSIVSKEWAKGLIIRKKKFIEKFIEKSFKAHILNNFCPCFNRNVINIYNIPKIQLYACYYIKGEEVPEEYLNFMNRDLKAYLNS